MKPTRKPTFPKTHPRNRGRCCSRKWRYFFQAERLERFTPGWRNWQTQRTQNPPDFGPWGFDSPSRHQDFLCVVNGIRVPGTALFFWQHNQTSRRTGSRIHNQTNNQTSRQNQSVPQKSQSKRFNLRRRYSEHRASKPATAAVRLSDSKMKSFAEYMDARRCGLSGRVSTLPAKRR